MNRSFIRGVGHYLPPNVVTNAALAGLVDSSDEWIRERSGIRERRFIEAGRDTTTSMAVEAARMALAHAALEVRDVDFIIFATLSPDYDFPGPGVLLQRELGLAGVGALDIRNQCSGFLYALSVADQFIKTGMYRNILVAGSEVQSTSLDMSARGRQMAVLFGDGAGAVVVSATETGNGILSTHLHADGAYAEALCRLHPGSGKSPRITHEMIDNGDLFPCMNGKLVFKQAVARFQEAVLEALEANGRTPEELDLLIPHQANIRIIEAVGSALGIPADKVVTNVQRYGNTTAASIPIALSEACRDARIRPGDLICLAAFGSGFTWASALIEW